MNKTFLTLGALCAVSCAQHPAPTKQVANSLAAVRGAEEAGGEQVPEAALHMQLAREQVNQAQTLMEHDQNKRAEDKAMRAGTDAELAIAIAHEKQAKAELEQFARAHPDSPSESTPEPSSTPEGGTP